MNIFGWNWDKGSTCHFLLGLAGGGLGLFYSGLFGGMFTGVELLDYKLRWERVKEGTDLEPESWERTKEEFFEFLLGMITGRIALVVATFALFGLAI